MQKQTDFLEGQGLLFDDLAVEIEDEYNPMLPNNYEKVVRERREEHERIREAEVTFCASVQDLCTNKMEKLGRVVVCVGEKILILWG